MTEIKICGIRTKEALEAASQANFVGFVFYSKSPRAIDPKDAAALANAAPRHLKKIGLFVDPDNTLLTRVVSTVKLDLIQLHGDETPQRVRDIAALTLLPVMKAVRVANAADIRAVQQYESVAQWLLFDAKVEGQQGGTGKTFDWNLLKGFKSRLPWMLSGGLNAANISEALSVLSPDAVDVSSGAESSPGVKDPALIRDFIATVRKNQPKTSSGAR